jgi:hypothetical protein
MNMSFSGERGNRREQMCETAEAATRGAAQLDWITGLNRLAWNGRGRRLWGVLSERVWIEKIVLWHLRLRDVSPTQISTPHKPVEFRFGDVTTIDSLTADNELQVSATDARYYADLLANGNRLVLGIANGVIAFHGTVALGRKRMYSRHFLLRDDEFFIMRCFTKPRYRGQDIYPRAIHYVCGSLKKEGFREAYLDIATHNEPSIRGAIKAGMTRLDTSYVRIRFCGKDVILPRGRLRWRFV